MRKKSVLLCLLALIIIPAILVGCGQTAATIASKNLSTEAEQFKIARQIVFINGITDKYLAVVRGYCSVQTGASLLSGSLEVTCKVGPGQYKKDFFGLSDNVTYMVQQINPAAVSTSRYEVIFRPSTLIPDIEVK